MAITQVGSATTGSSASSGSFSVNKPTGVASGDLLIMLGASNEGTWDTFPSGWTQLTVSTDASTANAFRAYIWYKVAGGSEPSSYSFGSSTASGSGAPMVGIMVAYRGADNTSPFPNISVDHLNNQAYNLGNPAVSFTQTLQGRQFFARFSRSVVGTPTYSTSTSGWAINSQIAQNSGGSTTYAACFVPRDADDGPGSRNEPSVPSGTDTTGNTTDNFYVLGLIEAVPEGSIAATIPAVTASMDGYHRIDAVLGATLPAVAVAMDGIAAPPSGPWASTLAPVTASMAGTSIGGAYAATLAPVSASLAGAVNPIGAFAATIPAVTAQFQVETRAFGEHVITVEPEHRAFLVTDEGDGLIPIKRSQVTNL
jgi:hypothetical protein